MNTGMQLVVETILGGGGEFFIFTFKNTISIWTECCIVPKNVQDICDFFAMFNDCDFSRYVCTNSALLH